MINDPPLTISASTSALVTSGRSSVVVLLAPLPSVV